MTQSPRFSLIAHDDEPVTSTGRFGVCPELDIMQMLLWIPCFAPNGMCQHKPAALHSNAAVENYIWHSISRRMGDETARSARDCGRMVYPPGLRTAQRFNVYSEYMTV